MKKVTKPHTPEENKYVFTEGLNYFNTGDKSIWGEGDEDTLDILKKTKIEGDWLNLAAGDGRYNSILLDKADSVTVSDVDAGALSKLWYNTPEEQQKKLRVKEFDITHKFPFEDNSFDGVFSTGVLHLFPKKILRRIILETKRVLKPSGKVIIDFATDVERISPEGELISFGREPTYSLKEAKILLKELFQDYEVEMHESAVVEDFQKANPPYKLTCKFVVLIATK